MNGDEIRNHFVYLIPFLHSRVRKYVDFFFLWLRNV